MPLDDELSDIRYAPREVLVRAIRVIASEAVRGQGNYDDVLAQAGLMDPKRPDWCAGWPEGKVGEVE